MAEFDRLLEDPLVESLLVAAVIRINPEVTTQAQARMAVSTLRKTMSHPDKLTANRETLDLLRDGAKLELVPGEPATTVQFIEFRPDLQHLPFRTSSLRTPRGSAGTRGRCRHRAA